MKYSEDRQCPKCGRDNPATNWDSSRAMLTRRCLRCGYDWRETPLDHPGDTPPVSPPKSDAELTRPLTATATVPEPHDEVWANIQRSYPTMKPEAHPPDNEEPLSLPPPAKVWECRGCGAIVHDPILLADGCPGNVTYWHRGNSPAPFCGPVEEMEA